MLEYLVVLLVGFWLGVAIFLYVSCYWLEEIFDLPPPRDDSPSSASSGHPSSGASGAHAQLKRLVARVVEEAAALPALARYATEPAQTHTISSSTYEDLLATAILNKVIERYQTENGSGGRSSGIHSASASPSPSERSSPRSMNSRHTRDITPPLHEEEDVSDWEEGEATDEALELPRRVPFPEFGGDIIHHTTNEDRDYDEVSGSDIQAVDGTWEENWLFQRKKIKTIQSVPVPMLVPNSNTEYRALIGDRDADDTTDLSDNASDAEEEVECQSNIKKVLDSKHVIGGKTKIEEVLDFEPDSLTILDEEDVGEFNVNEHTRSDVVDAVNEEIKDDLTENVKDAPDMPKEEKGSILLIDIDSGPLPKAEFTLKEEIHRTMLNGTIEMHDDPNEKNNELDYKDIMDKSLNNTGSTDTLRSRPERERESEETLAVPVQRHADSLRRRHFDSEPHEVPTRDTDEEDLIPGSIAYRERKKWLNCVDMPNNPYSPEAIKKRLSAKSTSSLFDIITSTNKDLDDVNSKISEDKADGEDSLHSTHDSKQANHKTTLNNTNKVTNGATSPCSPQRLLRDVLAEEVPQYKRYGRDYYIKEAKASSGGRKRTSISDTSSVSSMNISTSLDNFDTEFTSPVSASSSLSDLEAVALHQNIVRAVLSPRNASPNFAINPIFETPDRRNVNVDADENPAKDIHERDINGLLIKQFNDIATNQQYTKFATDKQTYGSITTMSGTNGSIIIEYDDANEHTLFNPKQTHIDSDTDQKFEEILKSAYSMDPQNVESDGSLREARSPNNTSVDNSLSSSSMDDSMKIYRYNLQTGEILKSTDNVSPRYETVENKDIVVKDNVPADLDSINRNGDAHEETVIVSNVSTSLHEKMPHYPNVRELAKKFVSTENLSEQRTVKPSQPLTKRQKSKENLFDPTNKTDKLSSKQTYMHSLTARSISKEFREELKLSMATPLKVPGGSKEIPEGIEEIIKESSRPGSPLPEPGTIKTKLAFFESLKTKFSSKS